MTAKFFPRSSARITNVWRQPRGDNTVRVWDEVSVKTIGEPMRHDDAVFSAQFSADGQRVVTASRDKTARVWMRQMTCCSSLTWLKLLVDLFSKLLAKRRF
jgi:WD40 repeat protein